MDYELIAAYDVLREALKRRGLYSKGLTKPVHRDLNPRQLRLLKAYEKAARHLETMAASHVENKLHD